MIHTIDCDRLGRARRRSDRRGSTSPGRRPRSTRTLAVGRIIATVENKRGVLAELCRIIAENEGDILNLRLAKRTVDFFDMIFDIEVADAAPPHQHPRRHAHEQSGEGSGAREGLVALQPATVGVEIPWPAQEILHQRRRRL